MKTLSLTLQALVFVMTLGAIPASAQSESDFVTAFAGRWQTLDPAFAADGACKLELSAAKVGDTYAVARQHCGGALAEVSQWGIVNNQLALLGPDLAVLARLGGNQNRMSGDTAEGLAMVFERLPANVTEAAPAAPAKRSGCVYYGYTATCVDEADLVMPAAADADATAKASTLVRLNARAEARPDAPVLATIPANTCVVVEQCTTASDGLWCRAKISNYSAWIPQKSVRANRWEILTFANSCG